jgi:type I restriction enzyme R subunit
VVIEAALAIVLPRAYTPELYQQKCEAVFAHIEKAYPERDRSVYSLAGLISPPQQPEHQGQAG